MLSILGLNAERQEEDAVAYMTQLDQVDIGIEFPPYEDPPPPYTPPKPHNIPLGESPPPYEENPTTGENEGNNNNDGPNTDAPRSGQNGVRPVQGRSRPESSQNHNGTVGRQNQRNQEMSQANGNCPNGDARPANGHCSIDESRPNGQANGIISRGRVIESLLGRASSSRSSPQSNSMGRKKDKKSARKNSTENYGLSVALANLGGGDRTTERGGDRNTETSPSRVMVHMHNNSPQSSLVRFDEEPSCSSRISNSTGPLPDVTNVEPGSTADDPTFGCQNSMTVKDKPKSCPDSWTQFIKKSDSIEIKRGSNSPRNSFYLEDKHFQPDYQNTCLDGGRQASSNAAANAGQYLGSNLSLLGAVGSSVANQSKDDTVSNSKSGQNCDQLMSKSMSCVENGGPHSFHEQSRHSMPPMILDLPIREGSKKCALTPETVKSQSATSPKGGQVGTGCKGSTPSGGAGITGLVNFASPPGDSSNTSQSPGVVSRSPQSPFPNQNTRSGSVASNASIFSVCSETGERKNPHSNIPYTLRNDVQYPLSPLSSLYSAPLPSLNVPVDRSPTGRADRQEETNLPVPSTSGASVDKSVANQGTNNDLCDNLVDTTRQDVKPNSQSSGISTHHRTGRKVIYRDADELIDNSSSPDSSEGSRKPSCHNKSTAEKSKGKLDKENVCSSQAGISPSDVKEKGSARKSKQKKRRSHDARDNTTEAGNTPADPNSSPEQAQKVEKTPSFKQYGFVDSPEVLKACQENGVFPSTGDQMPDPSLGQRVRKRSSSRERRRSRENSREKNASQRPGSSERGRKSRESSKSRSRSRERSRSRGRKKESPGTERRRKRRSRHFATGPSDIPSDVAIVNGDLEFSAHRHSHKSRSPGRRQRQRPTSSAAVELNSLARQEDQQNANTAIDSEIHDNTTNVLSLEPVNNFKHVNTRDGTVPGTAQPAPLPAAMRNCKPARYHPAQPSHSIMIDR